MEGRAEYRYSVVDVNREESDVNTTGLVLQASASEDRLKMA